MLDFRQEVYWSEREQTKRFYFNNRTAYQHYRLNIASVRNRQLARAIQIAEIKFFE